MKGRKHAILLNKIQTGLEHCLSCFFNSVYTLCIMPGLRLGHGNESLQNRRSWQVNFDFQICFCTRHKVNPTRIQKKVNFLKIISTKRARPTKELSIACIFVLAINQQLKVRCQPIYVYQRIFSIKLIFERQTLLPSIQPACAILRKKESLRQACTVNLICVKIAEEKFYTRTIFDLQKLCDKGKSKFRDISIQVNFFTKSSS